MKPQLSELLVLKVIMAHAFGLVDMLMLMDPKELVSHMNHAKVWIGPKIHNVN